MIEGFVNAKNYTQLVDNKQLSKGNEIHTFNDIMQLFVAKKIIKNLEMTRRSLNNIIDLFISTK